MTPLFLTIIRKFIAITVIVAFLTTTAISPTFAQSAQQGMMPHLPMPGVMVRLSPEFTPATLKGIIIHPENAFKFDFIIYRGDKSFSDTDKKIEYTKLIKYFLASLAVPDEDQWVNLSPYEKDRIIKDDFGKTEMGRDLLAQDYLLKQITASLIYPQDKLGQKFWDEVYAKAYKQFGTTNIPLNTFNKVWIVPDEADIYEKGNIAYLYNSHLKVMLEEDYLSLKKHGGIQSVANTNKAHALASQVVREIVLPQLEREVNTAKNFAPLRQVFSGMILAAWYKRALRQSLLAMIYANKTKLKGVDQDPRNNEIIYQQYLKAFKKGVFNFIKEDTDKYTNEIIPRKYFSGGAALLDPTTAAMDSATGLRQFKAMKVNPPQAAMKTADNVTQAELQDGFDLANTDFDTQKAKAVNRQAVVAVVNRILFKLSSPRWQPGLRPYLVIGQDYDSDQVDYIKGIAQKGFLYTDDKGRQELVQLEVVQDRIKEGWDKGHVQVGLRYKLFKNFALHNDNTDHQKMLEEALNEELLAQLKIVRPFGEANRITTADSPVALYVDRELGTVYSQDAQTHFTINSQMLELPAQPDSRSYQAQSFVQHMWAEAKIVPGTFSQWTSSNLVLDTTKPDTDKWIENNPVQSTLERTNSRAMTTRTEAHQRENFERSLREIEEYKQARAAQAAQEERSRVLASAKLLSTQTNLVQVLQRYSPEQFAFMRSIEWVPGDHSAKQYPIWMQIENKVSGPIVDTLALDNVHGQVVHTFIRAVARAMAEEEGRIDRTKLIETIQLFNRKLPERTIQRFIAAASPVMTAPKATQAMNAVSLDVIEKINSIDEKLNTAIKNSKNLRVKGNYNRADQNLFQAWDLLMSIEEQIPAAQALLLLIYRSSYIKNIQLLPSKQAEIRRLLAQLKKSIRTPAAPNVINFKGMRRVENTRAAAMKTSVHNLLTGSFLGILTAFVGYFTMVGNYNEKQMAVLDNQIHRAVGNLKATQIPASLQGTPIGKQIASINDTSLNILQGLDHLRNLDRPLSAKDKRELNDEFNLLLNTQLALDKEAQAQLGDSGYVGEQAVALSNATYNLGVYSDFRTREEMHQLASTFGYAGLGLGELIAGNGIDIGKTNINFNVLNLPAATPSSSARSFTPWVPEGSTTNSNGSRKFFHPWFENNAPANQRPAAPTGFHAEPTGLHVISKSTPAQNSLPYGGIDLNAFNLNMHIKRDGNGVPLPVGQQDFAQIHIDGLIPVILGITPAMKSSVFSALANQSQSLGRA